MAVATQDPRKYFKSKSCTQCLYKPCDNLRFGRVYNGKYVLVHSRLMGNGISDCPFMEQNSDEVQTFFENTSFLDLIDHINGLFSELSITEQLTFNQESYVTNYDDFSGRIQFLMAMWNDSVFRVIRIPSMTVNKQMMRWLYANESLEYTLQNKVSQTPDNRAAATDSMAQKPQAAAAPKKKEEITEIEVFVEGEEGPRKVNSNGTLEIVPDLLKGRKITCKEVNGLSVDWNLSGYDVDSKTGSEVTFQLRGWPKLSHVVWFPNEKPKAVRITAKDKQGKQLHASLNVFSGSKEIIELEFVKMPVWKKMEEIKHHIEDIFYKLTGRKVEINLLEGKIAYSANFEESEEEKVFYAYDFAGGLDPLFSAEVRLPIGPVFPAPKILEKYYKFIKFECFIGGGMALNFHFVKKNIKNHQAQLKSEPKIEFGIEGTSHIEAQILSKKIVVIDAKLGALSGLEGALGGFGGNEGLGVTGEFGWSGIKANGYISAMDGKFVYKKEITFVEPVTFIKREKLLFVSEKTAKEGE